MKSQKAFWIALICILIGGALMLFLLFQYLDGTQPRWKMHGALVGTENTVKDQFEFLVSGKYGDASESGEKDLVLSFELPGGFSYRINELSSTSTAPIGGLPYHVLTGYCYKSGLKDSVFIRCAFSEEKEYLIIDWNDGSGRYLVGSVDPSVTAQEIIAYFQDFLKVYCSKG